MSTLTLYEQGFGSFRVNEMILAMPMKSVREVVPLGQLTVLPCVQPWIKGGLDLRGVNIPVLDLECLLNRAGHHYEPGCILLIAHEGHLLGLLADQVKALFFADPANQHEVHSTDTVSSIFAGSLMNPELKQLVNILDPQALFNLPGLPKAKDPEPHRQSLGMQTLQDDSDINPDMPLMLMQSRSTLFAVNPKDIETTVVNPQLMPSEYTGGFYKGNLQYREQMIPALDLAGYLGLGNSQNRPQEPHQQAFVLRINNNPVAFLIDRVLDIVHVPKDSVVPLPGFGLPKARQLEGSLPDQVFPVDNPHSRRGPQYFVISCPNICEDTELIELANIMAKASTSAQAEQKNQNDKASNLDRLIVYHLGSEFASQIAQVREVLPYRKDIEIFENSSAKLGILTHRQEAIQVFDLAQWLGTGRQNLSSESSILLVHAHGNTIGFAVSSLTTIENAQWAPEVPVLGTARQMIHGHFKTLQRLAQIGMDNNSRMVEVIDLKHQVLMILDEYGLAPAMQEAQPVQEPDSVHAVL